MVISFINDDDFASISSTGPNNHPHIIDVSVFDPQMEQHYYDATADLEFRSWDAVVTLLHTVAHDTLGDFLNGSKKEVKIILSPKRNQPRVLIWKMGNKVLVSKTTSALPQ